MNRFQSVSGRRLPLDPPKLNSFGEAFRLNGYKIPDADAALVKEEPVVLGAPAWKQTASRAARCTQPTPRAP